MAQPSSSVSSRTLRHLPVAVAPQSVTPILGTAPVAPIAPAGAVVPVQRFGQLMPNRPTRREKQVGHETVVRAAVMEAHFRLQRAAAGIITEMHLHTHEQVVTGVVTMNERVRAVAHPDDQAELAMITAEQKAMYIRQHFGVLEAGAYRVAAEVDRELYTPAQPGVLARLLGS